MDGVSFLHHALVSAGLSRRTLVVPSLEISKTALLPSVFMALPCLMPDISIPVTLPSTS